MIEIGAIVLSPPLQKTTPVTEALYLMIRYAFTRGYRRCEWNCDALNEPSRRFNPMSRPMTGPTGGRHTRIIALSRLWAAVRASRPLQQ